MLGMENENMNEFFGGVPGAGFAWAVRDTPFPVSSFYDQSEFDAAANGLQPGPPLPPGPSGTILQTEVTLPQRTWPDGGPHGGGPEMLVQPKTATAASSGLVVAVIAALVIGALVVASK